MTTAAAAIDAGTPAKRTVPEAGVGGAWLLSGAMILSGVLTYAFHVLAARTLGPTEYGQIAVLWGAMFLVAVVLFRPLEQTLSRALAERLAQGGETKTVLRAVWKIYLVLLVAIVLAFTAFRDPLAANLFSGDEILVVALLAGTLAYGLAYLVRGLLGGVRWFEGYGIGLVGDAVARLVVALPLVVVASRGVAALAIVAAGVAGALIPLVLGRRRLRALVEGGGGERFQVRTAAGFAAPASVIAAADQLFVNGAPLLVIVLGGSTEAAGLVFAATMLVRAPVYVFQGVAAALLSNLTHLHAIEATERLRRVVTSVIAKLVVLGALIVLGVAVLGPAAMTLLYGEEFAASRADLVPLGAGVALYLAASTLSQALLALDRATAAAVAWATAAATFVGLYAALPGDELSRVGLSFATATLVCAVLLAGVLLTKSRGAGAVRTP